MTQLAAPLLEKADKLKGDVTDVDKQKENMRQRYERLRQYMSVEGPAFVVRAKLEHMYRVPAQWLVLL